MKRKSAIGKGITFLATGVLAILAFFRGPLEFRLLCGLFAIWALWMVFSLWLSPRIKRDSAWLFARRKRARTARLQLGELKTLVAPELDKPEIQQVLLMHVNCRISSYIKSAFPDATWTWCNDDADDVVLNGGIGRIRLYGADDYNFADIRIDRMARIECSLLKLIPLNGATLRDGRSSAQTLPFEPGVWYSIHGKAVIESCLAQLHSRGHSGLLVKENGDVCVSLSGNEEKQATLNNMPGRSCWPSLLKTFEINGITANATDKGIALTI